PHPPSRTRLWRPSMRRMPLILVLTLFTSLACGDLMGGGEPEHERSYYKIASRPTGIWKEMDLPYYGGKIEKCTDTLMEVLYTSDVMGPAQLKRYWPEALKAEGWTPRAESETSDGGFVGSYTLPDGRSGALSISPMGSL